MAFGTIPTLDAAEFGLPDPLVGLETLAMNLRWTWRDETQALFAKLAPEKWRANVNPVRILREIRTWNTFENDADFIEAVDRESRDLKSYLARPARDWNVGGGPVAYFCAEYALHTSMNQYAGGLGILAGDHCKEASDLGLPFVALGLFYRRGFFHQMIDWSGRQEAFYPTYDAEMMPVRRVVRPGTSEPFTVEIEFPGRIVKAAVWLFQVGRTPLLALDTDVEDNLPEDRKITSQLYTIGREMRICQEFVLGVGGVRVLEGLGIVPASYHLNEGHSAFLLLERLRARCAAGESVVQARNEVARNSILTIHTPVPEGNERFDAKLAANLIAPLLSNSAVEVSEMLALGLGADADPEVFDMTAFALRNTVAANGVSLLHGRTADGTWREIAGKPVIGITNGVHMPTWVGPEMRSLFKKAGASFEPQTEMEIDDARRPVWQGAFEIDDRELWTAHQLQKSSLIDWAQVRLAETAARHGDGPSQLAEFTACLDPDAFLIGFARRFATYKRAWLFFTDLRRATKILESEGRKVQFLFAGKSHPGDRGGQSVIERVYGLTLHPDLKGKVFLLEDYDMETGARLVQGVDLWLNNPRRPLEASGTSGMKAAANGAPNASTLDGWWDEAYVSGEGFNGWAIGDAIVPTNVRQQDRRDASALYRVLEREILPTFFERDASGLPTAWISVMKRAIATSLYSFSTARMIRDYVDEMYSVAGGA